MSEDKILPINKYSIYELKSGIDTQISQYLEKIRFTEIFTNSNIKILTGLITVMFTALAYFYPKPFPENYRAIVVAVIGYGIFSNIYWYVDNYVIKTIFYTGTNNDFFREKNKKVSINYMTLKSEIKEYSFEYRLTFEFNVGGKIVKGKERVIDCTKVYDERGYINKDKVLHYFQGFLVEEIGLL